MAPSRARLHSESIINNVVNDRSNDHQHELIQRNTYSSNLTGQLNGQPGRLIGEGARDNWSIAGDFSNGTLEERGRMMKLRRRIRTADLSARAENSALFLASDAELLNLGLEGGAFHAEPGGGPCRSTDHPVALLQGLEDVLTFGLFNGGVQ